jgi:hypothetical protein
MGKSFFPGATRGILLDLPFHLQSRLNAERNADQDRLMLQAGFARSS